MRGVFCIKANLPQGVTLGTEVVTCERDIGLIRTSVHVILSRRNPDTADQHSALDTGCQDHIIARTCTKTYFPLVEKRTE